MNFQPLEYIYKSSGNADAYTLLLLHGTGGDEKDLIPLSKEFGTGFNVLSLRGNVSENGMPRFFKRLGMGIFDEEDLEFRTNEMANFLEEIAVEKGFDIKKIVALGYSNGANIAGSLLVLQPDFLAGAILFRPMNPFEDKIPATLNSEVPIFLSSGKFDPMVNPEATEKYISMLKNAGFTVSYTEMNAGHNLTQDDLELSVGWFKDNFRIG